VVRQSLPPLHLLVVLVVDQITRPDLAADTLAVVAVVTKLVVQELADSLVELLLLTLLVAVLVLMDLHLEEHPEMVFMFLRFLLMVLAGTSVVVAEAVRQTHRATKPVV